MIHVRKHFRITAKPLILLAIVAGLGSAASCGGKPSKEIETLQQEAWRQSEDASSWFRLGNAYARQQQYRKAEEAYSKALAIDPNLENILPALGAASFNQGNYSEALGYFKKHQALAPNDSLRNYDLGNAYMQMRNYPEAIDAYKRAIENSISFDEAYYNLGVCYARSGRVAEAEEIYELLVKKNNYLAVSLKNHVNRTDSAEQ
ncbi:MAG: tetratricopeptide repeat protein [Chlorobium sp.]|jgi:tetratricopeptide (TPR) repeat protein|uniref:tetratricopeptide repeat protein n=1 Tax=Chlorobium sp. TaxID=1095 RepID=UPI001D7BF0D8|nr:tetratricopeptide repeat protein [Chlorobium sp.]MBN1279271.1 tetratricopeptide repeat protein [Chlorobiaceae bacterium]MCF8216092.1 tetratricopeptide repeat protein [Chlorobium sp.]MCF8270993.1 tetratricopeptide repeat protein [Chlorobium sp.]MCF8287361.1 tetratricopeptide repeat protein [Chlorobium sp.]MCF8290906.1 tetratricopeptide repeat protein [Chlorobium sp.]